MFWYNNWAKISIAVIKSKIEKRIGYLFKNSDEIEIKRIGK